MIEITEEDLGTFLHCSINYALGRRSYITGVVCGQVRKHWNNLPVAQQRTLTRNLASDMEYYDRTGTLIGDKCDDADWRSLLAWMQESLEGQR